MGIERRRFERVRLPIPLKFQFTRERITWWYDGLLLDISLGGMRFSTEESIPIGTELQFELAVPIRNDAYRFRGQTVWVREAKTAVEYGVELVDVTRDQENELNELVRFLSAPSAGTPNDE